MSHEYCILNLLNIEDKNIKLTENFYKIENLVTCKCKFHPSLYKYGTYFYKLKSGI